MAILIQPEPTEVVYWNIFTPHWDLWNETFGFMIPSVEELMDALNQSWLSQSPGNSDLHKRIRAGQVRAKRYDSNRTVLKWYMLEWVATKAPEPVSGCLIPRNGHWVLGQRVTDAPSTICITCLE